MGYMHGGKVVARALRAENVPFVFTLCGGHVMSIYDGCLDEGIRVIDTRHEQTAGHAADGWARVTGQPGVAIVTAGPGLTDAVTAVASAQRAHGAVVRISAARAPHICPLKAAGRPVASVRSQYWWLERREAYPKFVDTFGMPIYVNGAARGSLPPGHPYFFQQTRKEALKNADVVLIFGTPLDFRIGYGRESTINPQAKLIQVDLDGSEPGRNRACEVGIIGDTGVVMEQLTDL